MAHKLQYEITLFINETERTLLGWLGNELKEPGARVRIPARDFSERLNIPEQTVRRSCRSLASKGLISISSSTHPDGGRAPNEYRITFVGWEVLRSEARPRSRRAHGKG